MTNFERALQIAQSGKVEGWEHGYYDCDHLLMGDDVWSYGDEPEKGLILEIECAANVICKEQAGYLSMMHPTQDDPAYYYRSNTMPEVSSFSENRLAAALEILGKLVRVIE